MRYENIKKAVFIERPNRFIAYAKLDVLNLTIKRIRLLEKHYLKQKMLV